MHLKVAVLVGIKDIRLNDIQKGISVDQRKNIFQHGVLGLWKFCMSHEGKEKGNAFSAQKPHAKYLLIIL